MGDLSKAIVELAKTNACSTDIKIKIAPTERGNSHDAIRGILKCRIEQNYPQILILRT